MHITTKITQLPIELLVILLCANASAVEIQAYSRVFITPSISMAEVQQVDFGSLPKTKGSCQMAINGTLSPPKDGPSSTQVTDTTKRLSCHGNGSPGLLKITGQAGTRIVIEARASEQNGLRFSPELHGLNESVLLEEHTLFIPVTGHIE